MNQEIKRLLKLSNIPNFQLSAEEIKTLKTWENEQEKLVIPKKDEVKAPKGYKVDDAIGANESSTIVPKKDSKEKAEKSLVHSRFIKKKLAK